MSIEQPRIILTGASSGIGEALAYEFASRGARLVLVARRGDRLEAIARRVRELGGEAHVLVADVSTPGTSDSAVEAANREFGGYDLVILNAAVGHPMFAREFKAEYAERVMQVNYVSGARMIEAVLPTFMNERRGQIVAISSLAAYRGMPGSGAYNASKAALTVLMESLRIDLLNSGVTLTTIAPGFVRTEMTEPNRFDMPFLLQPPQAAHRIARAIERGRSDYLFPFPTALAIRVSRVLPNWIYDRTASFLRKTGERRRAKFKVQSSK